MTRAEAERTLREQGYVITTDTEQGPAMQAVLEAQGEAKHDACDDSCVCPTCVHARAIADGDDVCQCGHAREDHDPPSTGYGCLACPGDKPCAAYVRRGSLERSTLKTALLAFTDSAPIGEVKLLVRLAERIERGREDYARAVQANGNQAIERSALLDLYIAAEIAEEAS